MCGHAFFGADHLLFGSDYPYPGGPEHGDVALGEVIRSVEMMDITRSKRKLESFRRTPGGYCRCPDRGMTQRSPSFRLAKLDLSLSAKHIRTNYNVLSIPFSLDTPL